MNIAFLWAFVVIIACLAYVVLGFSAAGLGYIFLKAKGAAPAYVPPKPTATGWQFQYSSNVAGTPEDFEFPNQDGVHYCVKTSSPISIGQIITVNFTISGTGNLIPSQSDDAAPATMRLYLQRAGDNMSGAGAYEFYRLWSQSINLTMGDSTLSMPLNFDKWTGVFGKSDQTGFISCLANLQYIGFTFGGQYFAGHGVYANGPVHFHLNEFTVA